MRVRPFNTTPVEVRDADHTLNAAIVTRLENTNDEHARRGSLRGMWIAGERKAFLSRSLDLLDNSLVFTKLLPDADLMDETELLAAIASPRRQEILRLVWTKERPAGEIHAAMPDITFGAVSLQLRSLIEARLVTYGRKAGTGSTKHGMKHSACWEKCWSGCGNTRSGDSSCRPSSNSRGEALGPVAIGEHDREKPRRLPFSPGTHARY
jgi:DNA-binding transcriptional ArsR family regulator